MLPTSVPDLELQVLNLKIVKSFFFSKGLSFLLSHMLTMYSGLSPHFLFAHHPFPLP